MSGWGGKSYNLLWMRGVIEGKVEWFDTGGGGYILAAYFRRHGKRWNAMRQGSEAEEKREEEKEVVDNARKLEGDLYAPDS